jgi:hypothetical protein
MGTSFSNTCRLVGYVLSRFNELESLLKMTVFGMLRSVVW